jgi:hypothetical protein
MTRCPAHGNRIQLTPSRAVNLIGATTQPDCRWILVAGQQNPLAFLLTEAVSHVAVAALAAIDAITGASAAAW